MIRLDIIECAEPQKAQLDMLKQYASVPDNSRDALLKLLLTRAMKTVQDTAGKSLLPCTLKLTVSERAREDGNIVKLYHTPEDIVSVHNGEDDDIGFTRDGNLLLLSAYAETVIVTYKTRPDPAQADSLFAVVLQYATALYDGADTEQLAQILSQC
jgi:hypothetical protein